MNAGVATGAIAAGLKAEPAVGHVGRKRTDVTLETKKPFLAPRLHGRSAGGAAATGGGRRKGARKRVTEAG